ncbi:MAG TPA: response regulator [Marinobacterium sp.]|nr:response regulator [Marinobacterium sp.]
MEIPELPVFERERIEALRSLQVLDTDPEERFDRITRILSRFLDVPIALVSLVDENRQWFKSKVGLSATETPRDISFCGHAILSDDLLVIDDALQDARFADNPLVTGDPKIRFYAGKPLKSADGHSLGTLCAIDREPRHLSEDEILMLNDLAKMVEHELDQIELTSYANRESEARREAERAKTELAGLLERQKEMFAIVGHELRTPVAAIDMLSVDCELPDAEKIDQIRGISQGLLSTLDDLRTVISPQRALESKLTQSDPLLVIKQALNPLKFLIRSSGFELVLNTGKVENRVFSFHAQALRQAITNLVKNAACHSDGRTIYISFEQSLIEDGVYQGKLMVEDDGKGIPECAQSKIFEPFVRGDTRSEGTGLGLFIIKELAALMGGELGYTASQYGGAGFTLSFPLLPAESELVEPERAVSLTGLKVLLAEDDAMLRMLTQRMLEKSGAQVAVCNNGKEALDVFEKGQFDLVITDLMMPELDGIGLTRAIKASGSAIPIIGVTAAVVGEETDIMLREGVSASIPKPINIEKLSAVLSDIGFTNSVAQVGLSRVSL